MGGHEPLRYGEAWFLVMRQQRLAKAGLANVLFPHKHEAQPMGWRHGEAFGCKVHQQLVERTMQKGRRHGLRDRISIEFERAQMRHAAKLPRQHGQLVVAEIQVAKANQLSDLNRQSCDGVFRQVQILHSRQREQLHGRRVKTGPRERHMGLPQLRSQSGGVSGERVASKRYLTKLGRRKRKGLGRKGGEEIVLQMQSGEVGETGELRWQIAKAVVVQV
jgi:hypothetical protein